MTKKIHLHLPVIACFTCLFFFAGCNNKSTDAAGNHTDDALTKKQVKDFFTHLWTADCTGCFIDFTTPIRINPQEHHQFQDGLAVEAYPVKVDFTVSNGTLVGHHTGGVYYFYQNSFKEWEMSKEGVDDLH